MGLGDSDTMDEQERQALEAFKKFHDPNMAKYLGVEISRCRRGV
jgi:hypothetical protein